MIRSSSSTSKSIRAENRIERFVVKDRIHYFQISLNICLELPKRNKEIQPLLTAATTYILLGRFLRKRQWVGDVVLISKAARPDLQLWKRPDTLSKLRVIIIMILHFQRNKSWKTEIELKYITFRLRWMYSSNYHITNGKANHNWQSWLRVQGGDQRQEKNRLEMP